MKNYVLMLWLCVCLSCAQYTPSAESVADAVPASLETPALQLKQLNTALDASSPVSSRMIKTANYRFKVKDVRKTMEYIEGGLSQHHAFISSSSMVGSSYELGNNLVIKVRCEYFDDLLRYIDKEAVTVDQRNVSMQDVSKEFVDLESRLKTKREVEKRYMEILRTKAGTIDELLSAEKKIGDLHEDIEATISRINFLKDQVAYSTINLDYYQDVRAAAQDQKNIFNDMVNALQTGLDGLLMVVVGILHVWPLIVAALCTLAFVRYRRRLPRNTAVR